MYYISYTFTYGDELNGAGLSIITNNDIVANSDILKSEPGSNEFLNEIKRKLENSMATQYQFPNVCINFCKRVEVIK